MDLQLKGKLAFISGSTKGIGRAIAEALLKEGARVIVNGRSNTAAVVEELRKIGDAEGIDGDVSDATQAEEMCQKIASFGDLDILVNNMGTFTPQKFEEISDQDWMEIFEKNVLSTIRLSRFFFPKMLERDFGRVIHIASEAGLRGLESMVHYSTTKGAQVVIGRGMANLTLGSGKNVTVNSILPGPTMTEGVKEWLKERAEYEGMAVEEFVSKFFKETEPNSLLQRFIRPEEVANTVAYLASPLSSAINGTALRVEGGLIKHI
ncbi:SDR family oxidoreductase [Algivirga pacifica]|uniref:SDR family oxidoreductase n=1 Tax=Algivirga pacifica TaxID=1162670 RepID=A0ABP9D237_9BACT